MLRRLHTSTAAAALGLASGTVGYTHPSCYRLQQQQYSHAAGAARMQRMSALMAKTATAAAPTVSPCGVGAAGYSPLRTYATRPTAASHMRVQGVTPRNVPQAYNTGGSGGGSQADSLTPYVREHLTRVYTLLASGCAVAGVGSLLMITTSLAKVVPFWLPMAAGFVPLLWLSFAPPANPALKLGLFYTFTLLEGMAIAPLILATSLKGALVTSLVLTGAIFCGFSAASYLAPRASLVAWQGPLFGALLGMVALSVMNIFYPTAIAHSIILYGGLALFSVMVAVDTQAMIERARCGAGDHVQDALQLFLDMINIFVRIAQIMGGSE